MNWSSKNHRGPWLMYGSLTIIICLGLIIDHLDTLDQRILFVSFHLSGIIGLCLATYFVFKQMNIVWPRALFAIVVFLLWRISYFPIMVLAGYFGSLGESGAHFLGLNQVYPVFLLSIAAMNFIVVALAGLAVLAIFYKYVQRHKPTLIYRSIFTSITLPLAVIALAVSFSHPSDWHALPDTALIDKKPLPSPALPEINPYWTASKNDGISWQQQILFAAAAITYDNIPENTQWSQVVRGTLEKDFVTTPVITTAFCTRIHYRAFITAHPYLKDKNKFQSLKELH